MLSKEEVRALGDATNTTWGKSSTSRVPTISLKAQLVGQDALKITYTTLVTFASDRAMSQQMPTLKDQANQATNKYLSEIKKDFKESTGKSLSTSTKEQIPSVEIVSLQPHVSPKRTAYFRYVTFLDIN